jgi:Tfp pilus assembly protein FimT
MTTLELLLTLSIYAIIPLFCAYQVVQIGRNMNRRMDEIYSRYARTEEKILDVIEFRAKRSENDRNKLDKP